MASPLYVMQKNKGLLSFRGLVIHYNSAPISGIHVRVAQSDQQLHNCRGMYAAWVSTGTLWVCMTTGLVPYLDWVLHRKAQVGSLRKIVEQHNTDRKDPC